MHILFKSVFIVFVKWYVDIHLKYFLKKKIINRWPHQKMKTYIICPHSNMSALIKKNHFVFLTFTYTPLTIHFNFADVTLSERRITLWVGYTRQPLIVVYDILPMWKASNAKARRYSIDCKIVVLVTQSSL